jgi:hypothetical protein
MSISGIATFARSLMGGIVISRGRSYAKLRHVSNRAVDKSREHRKMCFLDTCPDGC